MTKSNIITPREHFPHDLGSCYRTEIDVADGIRGWWQIDDLDGKEICAITGTGSHWQSRTPMMGTPSGDYPTFEDALNAHLNKIQSTGGHQTDDLFWMGEGLPKWK